MEAFGVEQEIKSTLNRRVDLPSGGYLIFDYAEAFTVIDVNTGRFVGSRSKKSGARLEDTITKNNLEAVKEVVRQLRLRDIGGIIVIDFIDMASPKNRAAVEKALGEELERDRTKTYVVEISPLGLVEMTRQNVTDGPREVMTKKCPTCGGDGIVVSEHTAAVDIERRLRSLVTPGSRDKAFKVEVAAKVAWLVAGPGRHAPARARGDDEAPLLPRRQGGRASRPLPGARPGHAREGRAEAAGRGRPGGRASSSARSVCTTRTPASARSRTSTSSSATPRSSSARRSRRASPRSPKGWPGPSCSRRSRRRDEPLTAEAEAEKPTRARRSPARKKRRGRRRRRGRGRRSTTDEDEADDEPSEAEAASRRRRAEDGDGAPAVPKKRTRRGSRGGTQPQEEAGRRGRRTNGGEPADAETRRAEAAAERGRVRHRRGAGRRAPRQRAGRPGDPRPRPRARRRRGRRRRRRRAAARSARAAARAAARTAARSRRRGRGAVASRRAATSRRGTRPSPEPSSEPPRPSPRRARARAAVPSRSRPEPRRRRRLGLHADERVGVGRASSRSRYTGDRFAGLPPASIHCLWNTQSSVLAASSTASVRARPSSWTASRPTRARRSRPDVLLGDGARHREGARARARPEDPDRQVPQAHRLQAPQRLPRCDVAHRDLARRRRSARPKNAQPRRRQRRRSAAAPKAAAAAAERAEDHVKGMPSGYEEMTVAQVVRGREDVEPPDARGGARVRAGARGAQGRDRRARVGAEGEGGGR